jgi:hypothetical protein
VGNGRKRLRKDPKLGPPLLSLCENQPGLEATEHEPPRPDPFGLYPTPFFPPTALAGLLEALRDYAASSGHPPREGGGGAESPEAKERSGGDVGFGQSHEARRPSGWHSVILYAFGRRRQRPSLLPHSSPCPVRKIRETRLNWELDPSRQPYAYRQPVSPALDAWTRE